MSLFIKKYCTNLITQRNSNLLYMKIFLLEEICKFLFDLKLLQVILFVMMIALAIVVLTGVTFRFSGHALAWYDEVASVQLAWLTYYGSAYAALKGSHIGVPSILRAFPLSLRKIFISKIVHPKSRLNFLHNLANSIY